MSGLDQKQTGANKSSSIVFHEGSALLPVKRQKIETICVTLKNNKLTPWRWFKSLGIEITDFYGKPISMHGVCYDGTPVLVFWRFIELFLKDAIVRTLEETLEICHVKNYNAEPHLHETAMLLSGYLITPIYWEMVDIDRHLRGNGNPRSVPRRDPRVEIDDMERFLNKCRDEMIQGEANGKAATKEQIGTKVTGPIFIGHGQSKAWKALKDFIVKDLGLDYEEFNKEPTAGLSIQERLNEMLKKCCFAFLVMTAEDELIDGTMQARQNVVDELGLFRGFLGSKKAIILLEEGCERHSNTDGLVYIQFPKGNILAKSDEIRGVLEREGILKYPKTDGGLAAPMCH